MADSSLQSEIVIVADRTRTEAALLHSGVASLRLHIRELTQSRGVFVSAFAVAAVVGAVVGLRGFRLRARRSPRA